MGKLKYRRVLVKISGEGFCGRGGVGLSSEALEGLSGQIGELSKLGVQVAIVVGAGHLVRGESLSEQTGISRATADQMGMLATVINGVALQDVLEGSGVATRVLSAIGITAICEPFISRRAVRHLEKGRVIILAGGTGNPFFTTDTAAALRAAEIQAEVLIKATKVDGVYSADPMKDSQATMYERLDYSEVLSQDLGVMDHSAISLCKENGIDIIVCNLMNGNSVCRVVRGEKVGTVITHKSARD